MDQTSFYLVVTVYLSSVGSSIRSTEIGGLCHILEELAGGGTHLHMFTSTAPPCPTPCTRKRKGGGMKEEV